MNATPSLAPSPATRFSTLDAAKVARKRYELAVADEHGGNVVRWAPIAAAMRETADAWRSLLTIPAVTLDERCEAEFWRCHADRATDAEHRAQWQAMRASKAVAS